MDYDGLYNEAPPPRIRFETIGEAWGLFQKQMGPWLGAGAIAFVGICVLYAVFSMAFFVPIMAASAGGKEPNPGAIIGGAVIGTFVLVFGAVLLGGLMNAGFYRMAQKQIRGGILTLGDFFDVKEFFWPMMGMSFLVGMACSIGSWLIIPAFLLGGLWMLAGPLIVDRGLGAIDAMRASWRALQPEMVMAACYYFVISLVGSLGVYVLGIGILFTIPLFYLGLALVYRDFFPDTLSER